MTQPSFEDLQAALQSEDWGDRLKVLNALRGLDGDRALELLMQAAVDSNTRIRYAAISQIGTLELSDPKQPLELLRDRLVNDSELDVRGAAAAALGDLQQVEVLPDLLEAIARDEEWLVQLSIVSALGILGDVGALETILTFSHNDNPLIRSTAAGALGDLQDERGIDRLVELAEEEDWQIRHRTCIALGQFENARARATLETLSKDGTEQVAVAAQTMLESLGS